MTVPHRPISMRIATHRADRGGDLRESFLNRTPAPRIRHAAKGENIVNEGDSADYSLLLLEGWIALSKMLSDGDAQIIDIMVPGDFALIGARAVPIAACSVEALSDVSYILIGRDEVNGSDSAAADLREVLAGTIVATQARTSEILLRMGKSSAASRVAYALIELFIRLEAAGLTEGSSFHFPITQQRLGDFTGLSNVHVCRTLRRFVRGGLISYPDPAHIALVDLDALAEIAEIDLSMFRNGILLTPVP